MVTSADATTGESAAPSLISTFQVAMLPGDVASPEPISNVLSTSIVLYAYPSWKN